MPARIVVDDPSMRLQEGRDRDRRMVLQSLADPWQRRPDLDAVFPQVGAWPNAGPQQMRRGVDSAAGRDDFLAPKFLWLAGDRRVHADTALTVEDQPASLGVGGDGQVFPHPRAGI